jgi:hypothetical protein
MNINVLGTEYELIRGKEADYPKLKNFGGYTETQTKKIIIKAEFDHDIMNLEGIDTLYVSKIMRHEITHAFLFESGLDCNSEWGRDETLIDWIAIQIPKICGVMAKAECLQSAVEQLNHGE